MSTLPSQIVADRKRPEAMTKMHTPEISNKSEVAVLRKLVNDLQKQLTGRKLKNSESPISILQVGSSRPAPSDRRRQSYNDSDGNFCYHCGESSYYSVKCQNADNQAKVIQKLIHALK